MDQYVQLLLEAKKSGASVRLCRFDGCFGLTITIPVKDAARAVGFVVLSIDELDAVAGLAHAWLREVTGPLVHCRGRHRVNAGRAHHALTPNPQEKSHPTKGDRHV